MSGSIGGSRIPTKKVRPTVDNYINKVLSKFPGYVDCDTTGSYNVIMKLGQEKKDGHGDIDLVVHINTDDLKKTKKEFKKYLDSLPDELTPRFVFGNKKGEKSQLYGAIVTCGFPISGEEDKYVQVDNVIVPDAKSMKYQKTFLDLNAQKQALIQGLVRVVLMHSDKDEIWKHFEFEGFPEPAKDQEYEFVCSPTGLSLRLITLTPERKEDTKKRVELWRSNDWSDVEWLLRKYDIDGDAEECLEKVKKTITDTRSKERIFGIVNSMIRVGPGEVNTPKGDAKQAFIDLCKKTLLNESLKLNKYIQYSNMKNLNDFIIERGPAPAMPKITPVPISSAKKPHVLMIGTILNELEKNNNCKYDADKNVWAGKDAELWKSAGQFVFDYLQELGQKELKDIVDAFGWKKWIPDVNDINPQDVSMAISLKLQEK